MNNEQALAKMQTEEETGQLRNKITPKNIHPEVGDFMEELTSGYRSYGGTDPIYIHIDFDIRNYSLNEPLSSSEIQSMKAAIKNWYINGQFGQINEFIRTLGSWGVHVNLTLTSVTDRHYDDNSLIPIYIGRR
jgi:hypothetical protein